MADFAFSAVNGTTSARVKVHITLGGVGRGFTPLQEDKTLDVELGSGTYSWVARRNDEIVASGNSSGGQIKIIL